MSVSGVIPYASVEYKDTTFTITPIAPPIASDNETHAYWLNWLARTHYGIDWRNDIDPPCTLRELAKACWENDFPYSWEREPTLEDTYQGIELCIEEETGPWTNS